MFPTTTTTTSVCTLICTLSTDAALTCTICRRISAVGEYISVVGHIYYTTVDASPASWLPSINCNHLIPPSFRRDAAEY